MRMSHRIVLWLSLSMAVACGSTETGSNSGTGGALTSSEADDEGGDLDPDADEEAEGADLSVEDLDCPRGGSTAPIAVQFDCDTITVVSCKDLSNVVIELSDGTHQKFDGLSGQQDSFSSDGEEIVGVWVKAGNNRSGDGPGYGERFDAPEDSCDSGEETGDPGDGDPPNDNPPEQEDPPSDEPTPENPDEPELL
jgi:hypothetical protein